MDKELQELIDDLTFKAFCCGDEMSNEDDGIAADCAEAYLFRYILENYTRNSDAS